VGDFLEKRGNDADLTVRFEWSGLDGAVGNLEGNERTLGPIW
jgi:hypothetical protein